MDWTRIACVVAIAAFLVALAQLIASMPPEPGLATLIWRWLQ